MKAMAESDKQRIESANRELAETWADGVDVVVLGVPLDDAIQYDLLRIVGHIWLTQEAGDE